jgi:hypothetical protein
MMQIAVQVIYEGLAAHRWTEADLTKLSAEIGRQDAFKDCKFALRCDLAWDDGIIDYVRKNPEEAFEFCDLDLINGPSENFFSKWADYLLARAIPPGWFYQNQTVCARTMVEKIIPIANETNRTFSVKLYWQAENSFTNYSPLAVFHFFERMLMQTLPNTAKKFALCQATLDLADTAMALERYRLAKGNYPETLDVLAPEFIAQVPTDVVGGKALKYRREADGQFVLYSVGWNETDDGGVVVYREFGSNRVDLDKGDWVWRYPGK